MERASARLVSAKRRRALRTPMLVAATIVYGEDMRTVDCVIRDCSDAGIQIALPRAMALPAQFWLIHHGFARAYEAGLMWRRENVAGLQLVGHLGLDPITDPRLQPLRRIWLARASNRADVAV
jgi:hypothetical protein